jgi:stage II sporulation protein R
VKNTLKKWELALVIGLAAALLAGTAAAFAETGLEEKLIRLHVVAASDSEEDQAIKLAVRDEVLSALRPVLTGLTDAAQAERVIAGEIPALEERLSLFLLGSGQTVKAELRREAFPTREYATFALPAGPYTALRVTLDGGGGENWWCVVFPPLCGQYGSFSEVAKQAGLSDDEIRLIADSDGVKIRFRFIEIFERIRSFLSD